MMTEISANARWVTAIAAERTSGSGSIWAVHDDDCKGYEYHKQEFHFLPLHVFRWPCRNPGGFRDLMLTDFIEIGKTPSMKVL
ncbi:hypothetical protein [Rhizobium tubonense]|uniref:hypothetical protein n=1 Tax=Rhizobium tubonense TaxID=484088 RepID=UPI0011B7BD49|nr:hypothetical protein [Rhizobium tubonense]